MDLRSSKSYVMLKSEWRGLQVKENRYDDPVFFEKYSQMDRSRFGLSAAGEWETLKAMLPDFSEKRVLDLGCGYGWHCRFAAEHGAAFVLGVDLSRKMLQTAEKQTTQNNVVYRCCAIEDFKSDAADFDVVISSLAFHYISDIDTVFKNIYRWLKPDGMFVFSVEHPVFTACGTGNFVYDADGKPLYFPVDRYFEEGMRHAQFLGETVIKYHRTLNHYVHALTDNGFRIRDIREPQPPAHLQNNPGMREEWRRPMMLILSASKN